MLVPGTGTPSSLASSTCMELMKLCPEVCGDINPKNRSKKSMRSVFMWWAFDLGGGLFEEKRVYHGRRGLSRGRFWARPNKANHRSTVALFFGSLSGKSRANCSADLRSAASNPLPKMTISSPTLWSQSRHPQPMRCRGVRYRGNTTGGPAHAPLRCHPYCTVYGSCSVL